MNTQNQDSQMLQFMLITANPEIAEYVERHGVSRIFLDQETLGKQERQGHLNTHKAAHTCNDIAKVAEAVHVAEVMVRLNPLNENSVNEVNDAINHGAHRLMLPMFTEYQHVQDFLRIVNGRVPVTFLAETPQALVRLTDWLPLLEPGCDEVHVGLNDLSIAMKLKFLFEPIAAQMLDIPGMLLNDAGIRWGFGGIAKITDSVLPAELVMSEHVRLGSSRVILSRAFHEGIQDPALLDRDLEFAKQIELLRACEHRTRGLTQDELERNLNKLKQLTFAIGRGN